MKLKRNLIIFAVIIALLGAGYFFALKYEPPREQVEKDPDEDLQVVLFEAAADELTKIDVTNPTDSFVLVKSDGGWRVEGKDYIELTGAVDSYVYYFAKITAAGVVEEAAKDLSVYGLSEPQAQVTVSAAGEAFGLSVGAVDPTGNYYYVTKKDENTVYTVSKYTGDTFFKRLNSLRSMTVTNVNIEDVRGIEIKSGTDALKVVYSPLPEGGSNEYGVISVWDITSPISAKARNQQVVENVLTPACAITANDIVEDNPQDLSKYGLDKEVTLTLENGEVRFSLGSANGAYYAYPEGAVSVYSVSPESIAFASTAVEDIMETFVAIYNVDDVASVTYESDRVSGTLSKSGDNYSFDGAFSNKEGYTSMYQAIIGLLVDGIADKPYNPSEIIGRIHYKMHSGNTDDITFYGYDDLNYAVERGGTVYFIKKTKIAELEEKLVKFKKNPTQKLQ